MTNRKLLLKPNWLTAGPIDTCSYVNDSCVVYSLTIFLYTSSGYVSICEESPVQAT